MNELRLILNSFFYYLIKKIMKKIYEIIVDQIIEKLEEWIVPWKCTWKWWVPINYSNNNEYKWINRLLLSMNNFNTNYYLTYKQVKNLWWNINTWSKATKIIYWDIKNKTVGDKDNVEVEDKRIITKYYNVFNIEQTDIIPTENIIDHIEQSTNVLSESIIKSYKGKPTIEHGKNPCYIPSIDTIHIPNKQSFISSDEYYSTLFHELVHSTWSKNRLSREWVIQKNYYWDNKYSREELIAEIWSMFLSNYAWIDISTSNNSIDYIKGWLKFLKWNKRDIIIASSNAEKAVKYIAW